MTFFVYKIKLYIVLVNKIKERGNFFLKENKSIDCFNEIIPIR